MAYITLTPETLPDSHICCAISDKKCAEGYAAKKQWLSAQFEHGYRFRRLDERGKVFIEYGPAEKAWVPVEADGWLMMGCFWVSGRFKGEGHGKALLGDAVAAAREAGAAGLLAITGKKKMHFLTDGKWLQRQGFVEVDELDDSFSLLALPIDDAEPTHQPRFAQSARTGLGPEAKGVTVVYSDRCPFTDFHVNVSLRQSCQSRNLDLTVHKLESLEAARAAPTPATIFSLFVDGRFVTTDLSACMDSRFDKIVGSNA